MINAKELIILINFFEFVLSVIKDSKIWNDDKVRQNESEALGGHKFKKIGIMQKILVYSYNIGRERLKTFLGDFISTVTLILPLWWRKKWKR